MNWKKTKTNLYRFWSGCHYG